MDDFPEMNIEWFPGA